MGGGFSFVHWAIVILVIVLLFGRGKISDLMGDVAKGIKSFREGLSEASNEGAAKTSQPGPGPAKAIEHESAASLNAKRAGEEHKIG